MISPTRLHHTMLICVSCSAIASQTAIFLPLNLGAKLDFLVLFVSTLIRIIYLVTPKALTSDAGFGNNGESRTAVSHQVLPTRVTAHVSSSGCLRGLVALFKDLGKSV